MARDRRFILGYGWRKDIAWGQRSPRTGTPYLYSGDINLRTPTGMLGWIRKNGSVWEVWIAHKQKPNSQIATCLTVRQAMRTLKAYCQFR